MLTGVQRWVLCIRPAVRAAAAVLRRTSSAHRPPPPPPSRITPPMMDRGPRRPGRCRPQPARKPVRSTSGEKLPPIDVDRGRLLGGRWPLRHSPAYQKDESVLEIHNKAAEEDPRVTYNCEDLASDRKVANPSWTLPPRQHASGHGRSTCHKPISNGRERSSFAQPRKTVRHNCAPRDEETGAERSALCEI